MCCSVVHVAYRFQLNDLLKGFSALVVFFQEVLNAALAIVDLDERRVESNALFAIL